MVVEAAESLFPLAAQQETAILVGAVAAQVAEILAHKL